jgi:hypothetical protein
VRRRCSTGVISAAFVVTILTPSLAQPSIVKVEAAGTALRVTMSDGSVKEGTELVGAVLVFNINDKPVRIRIAAITPDANDRTVLLHDFRIDETDTPLCRPDPNGKQLGFPLVGRSTPDGRLLEAEPNAFELICTSGAQGKCVGFGYHPWERAANGRPMLDYYNACIRMVRADYCGDGRPFTRDGTVIDVYDRIGVQRSAEDPSMTFEAAWGADGATCVAHTRVPDLIDVNGLARICPRLIGLLGPAVCNENTSEALLLNRSR